MQLAVSEAFLAMDDELFDGLSGGFGNLLPTSIPVPGVMIAADPKYGGLFPADKDGDFARLAPKMTFRRFEKVDKATLQCWLKAEIRALLQKVGHEIHYCKEFVGRFVEEVLKVIAEAYGTEYAGGDAKM
jgi:hypothetical protein